jgi:hydroxymethylpyrimidine pyrophosphatase-like HAD family hydrolase
MIKKTYPMLIACLSVASCSFISFSDSIPLVKTAIFGYPNVPITENDYANREFSFVIAYFEKGPMTTFVLSESNNGIMKWVGSDGAIIFTKSGEVIKTLGLDHDYEALDKSFNLLNKDLGGSYYVQLRNPSGFFLYQSNIKQLKKEIIDIQYKSINVSKYVETVFVEKLNLDLENYYWVDENGTVVKSMQHLNPKLPPLTIEYFYKY